MSMSTQRDAVLAPYSYPTGEAGHDVAGGRRKEGREATQPAASLVGLLARTVQRASVIETALMATPV